MEPKIQKSYRHRRINKPKLLQLTGFLLFIGGIIALVLIGTKGQTVVSGDYPGPIETQSLSCSLANYKYPKVPKTDSVSQRLEATMIFNGVSSLRKISFEYNLNYGSQEEVKRAEATAHAEFSKALSEDHLSFTEFNNKFSPFDDRLIIAVYGDESDVASAARASYFMIDIKKHGIPKSLSDFKKVYEAQGFKCTSTVD